MKVKELIVLLQAQDPEMEVCKEEGSLYHCIISGVSLVYSLPSGVNYKKPYVVIE